MIKQFIFLCLIATTLVGCQPKNDYHYFMLHPEAAAKMDETCRASSSQLKGTNVCFSAERAVADIKAQIILFNLSRLRFGMQIMQAETAFAEKKQQLEQLSSQQNSIDRNALEEAVSRSQEKVEQLLAILLFLSEKPE